MKIVALSDTHGQLPAVPDCDICLIGGDVCPVDASHDPGSQMNWIIDHFDPWLRRIKARYGTVGIAGNHDFVFESYRDVADDLPWEYLQDSSVKLNGVNIYGSPYVPNLPTWAFHRPDDRLAEGWAQVPNNTDILMTHGPPFGIMDQCPESVGDYPLLQAVLYNINPKLHVFGHIHEGHGTMKLSKHLTTEFANVSIMDGFYDPVHKPTVFEVPEWS